MVTLTMVFVLAATSAFAATGHDERVAAELAVDKTDIKGGETIAIDAKVGVIYNIGVQNVRLNVELPTGLTLVTGSTTAVFDTLDIERAGELSLTAIADACPAPDVPATGDSSLIIAASTAALVASLGLVSTALTSRKRSKSARIISLLLCGVLLALAFGPLTAAMAAPETFSFKVVQPITICGVAKDIVLTVTYEYEEPQAPVTIILDDIVQQEGVQNDSVLTYVPGTNEFTLQRLAYEGNLEYNNLTLFFHLSDESVRTVLIEVAPFAFHESTGDWYNSSFDNSSSASGLMNAPYANTYDIDWAPSGIASVLWTSPRYGSGTLSERVTQTITLSVPDDPAIAPLIITATVLPGPNPN